MTRLRDGEHVTGGPEAGEWLQQVTLAIRARVRLGVLRRGAARHNRAFPSFSGIVAAAPKALDRETTRSVDAFRSPRDTTGGHEMSTQLPEPRLTAVYRLEATLGEPLELGHTAQGHRRIVPLTGGTFAGPLIGHGTLVPGASADWQTILPDGTALGDIRYTLLTDAGALLYVQSRGVRHGSPEVLERLARGEDVDPSEYTFRTATQIQASELALDWMNDSVFIGVAGRETSGVIYEIYLVA